jgi:hypothetical protein
MVCIAMLLKLLAGPRQDPQQKLNNERPPSEADTEDSRSSNPTLSQTAQGTPSQTYQQQFDSALLRRLNSALTSDPLKPTEKIKILEILTLYNIPHGAGCVTALKSKIRKVCQSY